MDVMVKYLQRIIIDEARSSYNLNFTFIIGLSLYIITINRDREYSFINIIYFSLLMLRQSLRCLT